MVKVCREISFVEDCSYNRKSTRQIEYIKITKFVLQIKGKLTQRFFKRFTMYVRN